MDSQFHTHFEEQRLARQDTDRNRILNICTALGGVEDGKYVAGDEAMECLRDLKRLLRMDNDTPDRRVFAVMGEWNVLSRDLVPLLIHSDVNDEREYKRALLIVQLLVPLTWTTSDDAHALSPDQITTLLTYKDAFLADKVVDQIMLVLVKSLSLSYRDRSEKDNAKIRLIITLFRNLLAIKDPQVSAAASAENYYRASLQEKLIVAFNKSNVLSLILTFAASMDEKEFSDYNMLVLEIVFLLFNNRTVKSLLQSTQTVQSETLSMLAKKELSEKAARPLASRHSRFGGTLSMNLGNGKMVNFFSPAAALKSVGNAMDLGKTTGRVSKKSQQEPVTKNAIRNEEAKTALKETADSFLEHSFNSLISSVKDDFDKERQHVTEGDFYRFLCVVKFFLEYQVAVLKATDASEREKFDFDTVTDFINARSMMFVTKRMQIYVEEKKWKELQAALECLKQILVTLSAMAESENEEYRDASNNIQNNLYYEAYIIEAICQLCRQFTTQSFGYLQSLVETVHIFMKMLERFSKSKEFMVVRRKSRQRASSKGKTLGSNEAAVVDHFEDVEDAATVKKKCVEHEFRFEKIEMDFANDNVVSTYYQLLKHYKDVEPRYLHYATTLLHRIFVKSKMEPFLYRLSLFELFNQIVSDERRMEGSREYKELKEFIRYVIKKFTTKAKENPLILIEILFPKNRGDCRRIMYGADDDVMDVRAGDDAGEFGEKKDRQLIPSDDELEIQRGLTWSEKLGVAVSILMEGGKLGIIEWLEITLSNLATKRMFEEESPDANIEDYDLVAAATVPDIRIALERNNKVHLLLELLHVNKVIAGDADVHWLVSKDRTADSILDDVKFLRDAIDNPVDSEGKPLHKLVKKKKKKPAKKLKPRETSDDDEKKEDETKKRKKPEKNIQSALSKQFVEDSDDDVDDDAFFEAERKRREKAASLAGGSSDRALTDATKKNSTLSKKESAVKQKQSKPALIHPKSASSDTDEADAENIEMPPKRRKVKDLVKRPIEGMNRRVESREEDTVMTLQTDVNVGSSLLDNEVHKTPMVSVASQDLKVIPPQQTPASKGKNVGAFADSDDEEEVNIRMEEDSGNSGGLAEGGGDSMRNPVGAVASARPTKKNVIFDSDSD
ncbi:timeless protein-domain-containing protein [Chytriomyces cf. hyalinus JEL632]|nr:timeless protein-domain-containing protein [Chytriomyces cf. hyalinus JEL632]